MSESCGRPARRSSRPSASAASAGAPSAWTPRPSRCGRPAPAARAHPRALPPAARRNAARARPLCSPPTPRTLTPLRSHPLSYRRGRPAPAAAAARRCARRATERLAEAGARVGPAVWRARGRPGDRRGRAVEPIADGGRGVRGGRGRQPGRQPRQAHRRGAPPPARRRTPVPGAAAELQAGRSAATRLPGGPRGALLQLRDSAGGAGGTAAHRGGRL